MSIPVWLTRAAHVLVLAFAPRALSPEPLPPEPLGAYAAASAVALVAIVAAGWWFRRQMDGYRGATAAAVLATVAVATALAAAAIASGPRAPLGRAIPTVAVPAWGTVAAVACASADRWLGSSFRHRRAAAVTVVLAFGARVLTSSATYLGSTDAMWRSALWRDGRHERAVHALVDPALQAGDRERADRVVNQCLSRLPDAPACIAARAEVANYFAPMRPPGR